MSIPTLMTAEQLTCYVDSHIKDIITEPDLPEIPWNSTLSDHLPVFMIDGNMKIMSWNILNERYIGHLKPAYKADNPTVDISQRISHCAFTAEEYTETRERLIVDYVVNKIDDGFVVCLQEVSPQFVSALSQYYMHRNAGMAEDDDNVVKLRTHVSDTAKSEQDMNATFWDAKCYNLQDCAKISAPDCGIWEKELKYIIIETAADKNPFAVVNVHVGYHCNKQYAELLLAHFTATPVMPVFVCGDFNCSARAPVPDCSEAVERIADVYSHPVYMFAVPPAPYYTHVNKYQNTRSTALQLDKFDYIMVMKNDK